MHPTLIARPFHREGWVYEEKYDGWRLVAYKADDQVRLVSRNGLDHTRRFAELAAAIIALPVTTLILDGEVAIFDEQLVSRFEWGDHPAVQAMRVREVTDEVERGRLWKLTVAAFQPYEEYQSRTTRQIPVFLAEPRG